MASEAARFTDPGSSVPQIEADNSLRDPGSSVPQIEGSENDDTTPVVQSSDSPEESATVGFPDTIE